VTRSEDMRLLVRHLRHVETNYGLRGWHDGRDTPALYVLDRDRVHRLPIGRAAWGDMSRESPGQTLLRLARLIDVVPDSLRLPLVRDKWYGMAFAMEGWAVEGRGGMDPSIEELSRRRLLHTHPRRISVRTTQGMTVAHDRAATMRREDRPQKLKVWTSEDPDPGRHVGAVWDGLTALVAAMDAIVMGHE